MKSWLRNNPIAPAALTGLLLALYIAILILQAGGDPLELAQLGTQFSQGDPEGTEGYDGQFVVYIARDPRPESVAPLLDVPAYRYQRILLPMLARLLSFGVIGNIPWVLAGLGVSGSMCPTISAEGFLPATAATIALAEKCPILQ